MSIESLFTVPELSRELHITERTIRFYETKGLVTPRRVGKTRIFNYKDKARLIIVLRAKKLGFSLSEIKTYLDFYDVDTNHNKPQNQQPPNLGYLFFLKIQLYFFLNNQNSAKLKREFLFGNL